MIVVHPAMTKVNRQPMFCESHARGDVASMEPRVPIEMRAPERVENLLLGNFKTKTLKEPINTEAIPIPMRTLPAMAKKNVFAMAKTRAPQAPTKPKTVMIYRGPTRSRRRPMGICIRAKE